ncbi:MAG: hypothetical protein LH479_06600, partial [Polaromonas sp.]|nr:hypothetical protein [Polaromonas sp.]
MVSAVFHNPGDTSPELPSGNRLAPGQRNAAGAGDSGAYSHSVGATDLIAADARITSPLADKLLNIS